MRDPPPHLTTRLLCSAFPEMPAILDIDLSAFLTTAMSTTNYPPMPIVEDIDFQPYIAQAWVAFQADRVSKDNNKKHLCFNGVEIPPCKTPSDKAPNPESHQATVSEEMEVLSPELQQVAKATLAPVPVVASDQPSRPNARTSPALLPSVTFGPGRDERRLKRLVRGFLRTCRTGPSATCGCLPRGNTC